MKFNIGREINTPEGKGEVMLEKPNINGVHKVKVRLGLYKAIWFDKEELEKIN